MLINDHYKVNKKEYCRLLSEENKFVWDFEEWSIISKRMFIHKDLNNLFQQNYFLFKLFFSNGYSNLLSDINEYGCIGGLTNDSFDHTLSIQLCPEVNVENGDTVTGIVTFPYFQNWDEVENWINQVPLDNYSVYIINPILIFYWMGTVGLFLTPKYYDGTYIELCNRYIISLTGYPLFLTFSNDENVDEIKCFDYDLSKSTFVRDYFELGENNIALCKLLNFWCENSCVSIQQFEDEFKNYMSLQPFSHSDSIRFIKIISKIPFKVVHEDNSEVLGSFKQFRFNAFTNKIETDNGDIKLTDLQVNDLLNGKYDFSIML